MLQNTPSENGSFISWICFIISFRYERCNSRLVSSESTPLHYSSEAGHVEVCQLLVAHKADINAKLQCGCRLRKTRDVAATISPVVFAVILIQAAELD